MWSGNTLKGMPCLRGFRKRKKIRVNCMHILDQTWYTKATFYWAPSKVTWNFPLIRQHTGLPQTPAPSEHTLRDYMKEHERHQGAHWLSLFAPAQAFLPQQAGTQASWWKGIPSAAAGIDRRVCVCAWGLRVGGIAGTLCAMAPGPHTSAQ